MAPRTSAKSPYVTIIADNPQTIDGLQAYLGRAGLALHTTRDLRDAGSVPPAATAVVIFPDDYAAGDVMACITQLRAARPRLLLVIVTSAPQNFRVAPAAPAGRSLPPIVLPKPAFGWTILDVLRAHVHSESP